MHVNQSLMFLNEKLIEEFLANSAKYVILYNKYIHKIEFFLKHSLKIINQIKDCLNMTYKQCEIFIKMLYKTVQNLQTKNIKLCKKKL